MYIDNLYNIIFSLISTPLPRVTIMYNPRGIGLTRAKVYSREHRCRQSLGLAARVAVRQSRQCRGTLSESIYSKSENETLL